MPFKSIFIAATITMLTAPASIAPALAQTCPADTFPCAAGWCCPLGEGGRADVCCNDNPREIGCTRNGLCGTDGGDDGNDGGGGGGNDGGGGGNDGGGGATCGGDAIPTLDTCAETSCSCADPCGSDGDCGSGCCADGFCALACTCRTGSPVTYNCGTSHPSTDAPRRTDDGGSHGGGIINGCTATGGAPDSTDGLTTLALGLAALTAAAGMTRRRHRR